MNCPRLFGPLLLAVLLPAAAVAADDAPKRSPREALQAFNDLIGSWRGSGEPNGTREDKQKGFWQETIAWQWQFKGDDAWLAAAIDKGKYFTAAELRYLPDGDRYQLTMRTPAKEELVFKGTLADRRLTVERIDDKTGDTQRLVVSLLHSNRYLFRCDVKPADRPTFTPLYQVGATKEGVAFASVDEGPECVVSGGHGTMSTTYKGKTYYFCCTGCRDAFADNPEKYIQEYEAQGQREGRGQVSVANGDFSVFHLLPRETRTRVGVANEAVSLGGGFRGRADASRPDHNAFHPRKGKPSESWRRKAMGRWRPAQPGTPWLPGCRRDETSEQPVRPATRGARKRTRRRT